MFAGSRYGILIFHSLFYKSDEGEMHRTKSHPNNDEVVQNADKSSGKLNLNLLFLLHIYFVYMKVYTVFPTSFLKEAIGK